MIAAIVALLIVTACLTAWALPRLTADEPAQESALDRTDRGKVS